MFGNKVSKLQLKQEDRVKEILELMEMEDGEEECDDSKSFKFSSLSENEIHG